MSGAIFMNKLLEGVSVEWTTLGDERFLEVANAARRPVKASLRVSGMVPYYGANNIQDYVDGYTHDGEYVLIAEDGSASLENYSVQYATGKFWANNHVHVVRGKEGLNTRFLYHYLCAVDFIPYLPNKDRSKLTKGEMIKIPLPIPCPDNPQKSLEIQAEIARILDAFTELTAELVAELVARKKQYNHYRDQLLNFDEGEVEWKCLSEIAYFHNAKPHEKLVSPDGDIALITAGFISTDGRSARYLKKDAVLTPALQGDVAMVMSDLPNGRALAKTFFVEESGRYAVNQRVCLLRVKEPTLFAPRFLHYVMNRNRQLLAYDSGVDQTHLKKDWILSVRVPAPPLVEQNRIVAALDKFDAFTSSLTDGLPREIELRQKQYEHYRDLLLTFPKPEEVGA